MAARQRELLKLGFSVGTHPQLYLEYEELFDNAQIMSKLDFHAVAYL